MRLKNKYLNFAFSSTTAYCFYYARSIDSRAFSTRYKENRRFPSEQTSSTRKNKNAMQYRTIVDSAVASCASASHLWRVVCSLLIAPSSFLVLRSLRTAVSFSIPADLERSSRLFSPPWHRQPSTIIRSAVFIESRKSKKKKKRNGTKKTKARKTKKKEEQKKINKLETSSGLFIFFRFPRPYASARLQHSSASLSVCALTSEQYGVTLYDSNAHTGRLSTSGIVDRPSWLSPIHGERLIRFYAVRR